VGEAAALHAVECPRAARYHGISLSWDIKEAEMTDMLIRDVPDDVIAALDAHAGRLGLSRSEYVRRRLAQDAARPGFPVSVQDLARFSEIFGDLADPDVMSRAWS
jgi:Ribbon-helix-helix protein, copG family